MADRDGDLRRQRVRDAIRSLHGQSGGLTRVHRTHPALYARARRAYGSWAAAVADAGLDYARELDRNLRVGLLMRDQRRALWQAVARLLRDAPATTDEALERARPELAKRIRRTWGSLAEARAWAARHRGRSPAPES